MKQVVALEGWIYANSLQVAPVHVTLDDLEDLIGALSLEVIIWKPFSVLDQSSHIKKKNLQNTIFYQTDFGLVLNNLSKENL